MLLVSEGFMMVFGCILVRPCSPFFGWFYWKLFPLSYTSGIPKSFGDDTILSFFLDDLFKRNIFQR